MPLEVLFAQRIPAAVAQIAESDGAGLQISPRKRAQAHLEALVFIAREGNGGPECPLPGGGQRVAQHALHAPLHPGQVGRTGATWGSHRPLPAQRLPGGGFLGIQAKRVGAAGKRAPGGIGAGPLQRDTLSLIRYGIDRLVSLQDGGRPTSREAEEPAEFEVVGAAQAGHQALGLHAERDERERDVVKPRLAGTLAEEDEELHLRDRLLHVEGVGDALPIVRAPGEIAAHPPQMGAIGVENIHIEAVVHALCLLRLAPAGDLEGVL